ncbi:uncharacterized protein LOC132745234 [Ruditapes philippinarum]|uniref:uncharacterized protein LOC132745234 n=1 Tax=Ruditapes philippinarum TaxID=129788 RepID=UPI00295ACB4B|nr:uncharacterized protein LOC132745234 [Ruditapes philippinarum]
MERTRCHPYSRGRENQNERDKMQDAAVSGSTIWNCVNSVQMLFSTMKESMLDILTPSWLSDFLTRLHISSNIETQPETCCPESGMQAVVNQTEDQLRRSEILLIQDEKSESPDDINTISDDKGQGQGHLRSLLHHKEVKANHSCTEQQYRTCDFNPEASSRVCVTRQHQMCGKMSSELKRKIEIDKENNMLLKRQKTTGGRNDIVEKLQIQERPSQTRAREVLTDLESRRILHALNRDHKPLFTIIPDLQFGPKAPKLKYFVPPFSHKKNKEAASDDTRTESADVLPTTSLDVSLV